ncbi:hypothetical protein RF11_13090 [Thelohanellus kitauei]|uniref:Uncharacterized protein n=1 Tax=Thelohanellus kitauei TaxID=669202 RepID=A0A0C2MF87_THEKT|nr:hypothetical protein RF11_13090 [Thelohanellus kitauei]
MSFSFNNNPNHKSVKSKNSIIVILTSNSCVFSKSKTDIGFIDAVKRNTETKSGTPFRTNFNCFSASLEDAINKQLDEIYWQVSPDESSQLRTGFGHRPHRATYHHNVMIFGLKNRLAISEH